MDIRPNWPYIMIAGSVLLLSLLIILWLNNSYQGRINELKQETNYLYVRAIRNIEDSLVQQTIFRLETNLEKTKPKESIFNDTIQSDTIKFIALSTTKVIGKQATIINNTNHDTIISVRDLHSNIPGTISFHVNFNPTKNLLWTPEHTDTAISSLLKYHFKKIAEKEHFHLPYEIIKSNEAQNKTLRLVSTSYRDINTGEEYAISLTGHSWYILKKMVPEFIFALVLLSLTVLSFYLINSNLQKQKNLNLLKNDFINNMTHELKTPLTTASVAIEAIRNQTTLPKSTMNVEYLDICQRELKRLDKLVDKVLNVSQWDEHAPELQIAPININVIIREVLEALYIQIEKLNATVNIQIPTIPVVVPGDKILLFQAIFNLVDNALKYGGVRPKITLRLITTSNKVFLSVEDSGPGIPLKYQDKIFDKFFRVPNHDEHNVKGHGLGLNYVKNIINKHNGRITFSSSHKGTIFNIELLS